MGCSSSHIVPEITYATPLPNTENLEKGIGAIYRAIGCEENFNYRPKPEIVTLVDLLNYGMKRDPSAKLLGHRPIVDGVAQDYTWRTYQECNDIIDAYSRAIVKYNLLAVTDGTQKRTDGTPMQTMGHFLKNSPSVFLSQYACWRLNGTVATLYDTLGPEAISTIVKEAEMITVLCTPASAMLILRCMDSDANTFTGVKHLIIDGEITEELKEKATAHNITLYGFWELVEEGRTLPEVPHPEVKADDVCMICYTSGTTGVPKGAIITHGNMVAVTTAVIQYIDTIDGLNANDCHVSYLPMAHVFEHFVQCAVVFYGAHMGFSQGDTTKIVDDFQHLRPTVFPSVPRLLNRITDSIFAKIRKEGGVKKMIFDKAFASKKAALLNKNSQHVPVYDQFFRLVSAKVGLDRLKFIVTGSAPISDECLIALRVILGCPVIQGLGLSETGGGICCSFFQDQSTVGHCGGIICCSEARLVSAPDMGYLITDKFHRREVAEDGTVIQEGLPCVGRGEVCFRGHNIISGYYKRPEINSQVFDEEGWFHSGDIAMWQANGSIRIIDRKKDIFKLAQGEYISPDKVTAVYQDSPLIGSLFVYGDSYQSFLVGIVIPDEAELRRILRERGLDEADMDFPSMCRSEAVRGVVFEEMDKIASNSSLMGFEKVKNIHLDSEAWTVENGMLTPTMKLKRDHSKNHYKAVIDKLYQEGMMKVASK